MKAEIIATGTEILLGEIVDTNTSFLAGELALLGIDIHFTSSVGDNFERFSDVLRHALQRSNIIITTGGLGPTQGDITRNVISAVLEETQYIDERLRQNLAEYFGRLGVNMPENNLKQAMLIPSAKPLLNPLGTAPGWWAEKDGRIVITLPGPPGELQPMWRSQVVPRLQKMSGALIVSRVLKTWGLSEGRVDELMTPFLSSANPTTAIYARQDGIVLRITAKSKEEQSAREMISAMESRIRNVLKDAVWGVDEETMAGSVLRLLDEKSLTLAVCESMTGGYLTYTLASAAGDTSRFKGSFILNNREAGIKLGLALPAENDVSASSAAAMAILARTRLDADIGIGLEKHSGITDHTENNAPVARASIAIDTGRGECRTQEFTGRPNQIARRATMQALFSLRNLLISL